MEIIGFAWQEDEKAGSLYSEQREGRFRGSAITSLTYMPCDRPYLIGYEEFCDCRSLREVLFQPGLVSLGERAFEGCLNLIKIRIPWTLRCIEPFTFKDAGLRVVYLEEGVQMLCDRSFLNGIDHGCIHLPASLSAIHPEAFYGCKDVVFHVVKDTYACDYVKNKMKGVSEYIVDAF